jgi:small GTP-binding protein
MARPRRPSTSSTTSSLPSHTATTASGPATELSSSYDYLAKIILLGPSGSGKSCLLHRFVKNEWRVLSSQTIGVEFSSKIVRIGVGTGKGTKRIKLQLWDTAGTERFRSVSRSYYRGAAGAILVYDVASLGSFQALPTFLMDARALASPQLSVIVAGNKADLAEGRSVPQGINGNVLGSGDPPATPSSASSKQSGFTLDGANGNTRSRGASVTMPTTSSKWTVTTLTDNEGREVTSDTAARWASKAGVPVTMEVSALSGDNVDELFNRLARMILTKIELGEIDPDDPQSGIQYGDVGFAWDGDSVKSGSTADGRRRRRRKGILRGLGEWGDVFRSPAGGRGGCC